MVTISFIGGGNLQKTADLLGYLPSEQAKYKNKYIPYFMF